MYKYFISLRYIQTRLITLLCITGVAIGVMVLLVVISVMSGFKKEFETRLQGTLSDLMVTVRTEDKNYEEIEKTILENPQVTAASPHLSGLILIGTGQFYAGGMVVGIDYEKECGIGDFRNYLMTSYRYERLNTENLLEENIKNYKRSFYWKVFGGKAVPKGTRILCEKIEKPSVTRRNPMFWYTINDQGKIISFKEEEILADSDLPPKFSPEGQEKWQNYFSSMTKALEKRDIEKYMSFYAEDVRNENGDLDPNDPFAYPGKPGKLPVIVGYELLRQLDMHYGQTIALVTGKRDENGKLTPVDREFIVVGSFRSGWQEMDAHTCYVRRSDIRDFLDWDSDVKEISIAVKDPKQILHIKQELNESLNGEDGKDYLVERWQDRRSSILSAIEFERSIMKIVLFFIIILALVSIMIVLVLMVAEKTKDIGILKSMGASRSGIMSIFLFNGIFISFCGACIGGSLGYLISKNVNWIADRIYEITGFRVFPKHIYYIDHIPSDIDAMSVIGVVVPTMLVSLIFCSIPSLKAARMDVVKALNSELYISRNFLTAFFSSLFRRTPRKKVARTTSNNSFYVVEGVSKEYMMGQKLEVLKNVSLSVKQGELLAIVGTSGAGKSTLLHIMGLLDPPTDGAIYQNGENVSHVSTKKQCRIRNRDIGFIFQFYHLLPEFTALENVLIAGMIGNSFLSWQKVKHEKIEHAKSLLEKVGLQDRKRHRPIQLSGGERQRVAIARALMNNPKLVLCDEPTGNLDEENSAVIQNLIKDLNQQTKQTFVIITHDSSIADRVDRILHLENGKFEEK